MNRLRPFFSYYGSKWRAAPLYPKPQYETIIEPFAGSACYALLYPYKNVRLYDVSDFVCGVWDYLIHTDKSEILALPNHFEHVDDLDIPQEAKWLLGFWAGRCNSYPKKTTSEWRGRWGVNAKHRIATQQPFIRHWKIFKQDYKEIPSATATWFIDPPYAGSAGRKYAHNQIDYNHLAGWSHSRMGQAIVCEQDGADWLPFEKLGEFQSFRGSSTELVWTINQGETNVKRDRPDLSRITL